MTELVESPAFDIVVSTVILLNAVTIGIEQTLDINGKDTIVIKIIESVFLILYSGEFLLRFTPKGLAVFRDAWVRFDFLLIILGILQSWIMEPLSSGSGSFGPLMVLRMTRLFRLAKTMRLFSKVEACWMLVRGFMNSASIMFYSLMILFFTLYAFACMACEIITKHSKNSAEGDPLFHAEVEKYWSSLPQIMLTLARFACLDNTSEVYKVLVEQDPWLSIYFVFLILVVSLVLFHLLGAVIFSSVLEQHLAEQESAKRATEAEWASLIQNLKKMFLRIDVDGSGTLSREELLNIDPKDNEALTKALGVSTPMQVFNALDVNKTGEVSIAEFVNIIWDVVLKNTPLDLKRMEKQVETMDWRVKEMFSLQHDLQMKLANVLQQMQDVKQIITPMVVPNGKSNGHANVANGHAPSTNGQTPNGHNAASHNGSSAQKESTNGNSNGNKVRHPSKSPPKQFPAQTADELIDKLRQTWEESLVFAFEHVSMPVSATWNSTRNGSSSPILDARGTGSQAVKTTGAARRRQTCSSLPTPTVGDSCRSSLTAEEDHRRHTVISSPSPPSTDSPARAIEVRASGEASSSIVIPVLPEDTMSAVQPNGEAGAPQPPPVAMRSPMGLSGLPPLQARQHL